MVSIDLSSKLVEYQGEKVILGMVRDITERRRTEELVRQANLKLKEMRHFQALQANREEERKRLAGELHYETLADLANLGTELTLLKQESEVQPELEAGLAEARESVRKMDRSLREIVQGIYPSILSDMGLLPAIDSYLKQLASHPINNPDPLDVTLRAMGFSDEQRLPEAVEIALYRTIQQRIANVISPRSGQQSSNRAVLEGI